MERCGLFPLIRYKENKMSKVIVINRGLPGSGKSYAIKKMFDEVNAACVHQSTDFYWIRPDGKYDWNPKLISQAHEWNFNYFREHLECDFDILVCDNTNIQFKECQKYIDASLQLIPKPMIVLFEPNNSWSWDVQECAKRNSHGVPEASIQNMKNRWESSESISVKFDPNLVIAKGYEQLMDILNRHFKSV